MLIKQLIIKTVNCIINASTQLAIRFQIKLKVVVDMHEVTIKTMKISTSCLSMSFSKLND